MTKSPRVHRPAPLERSEEPSASRSRKVKQILPVASDLFLRHGFEAVTMDEVARAAGVSKATLYAHFASKEDLFAVVMQEEARVVNAKIWEPCASATDVEAVLRKVAQNYFKVFLTERTIAAKRAVLGALHRFPDAGRVIYASGPGKMAANIAAFLAAACDDGRLIDCDPHLAAQQFMSLMRGDFELGMVLSVPPPSQAQIDASIDATIATFFARYGNRT